MYFDDVGIKALCGLCHRIRHPSWCSPVGDCNRSLHRSSLTRLWLVSLPAGVLHLSNRGLVNPLKALSSANPTCGISTHLKQERVYNYIYVWKSSRRETSLSAQGKRRALICLSGSFILKKQSNNEHVNEVQDAQDARYLQ